MQPPYINQVGTVILSSMEGTDEDVAQVLSYFLTATAPGLDYYESTVKIETAQPGSLTLGPNEMIDFETLTGGVLTRVLSFTVGVTDNAVNPLSASCNVEVIITDVNEPPRVCDSAVSGTPPSCTFANSSLVRSVDEGSGMDTNVGVAIVVFDPDEDDKGKLSFKLTGEGKSTVASRTAEMYSLLVLKYTTCLEP